MCLRVAVRCLLLDIRLLERLYHQLFGVPNQVRHLFALIANCRAQLAELEHRLSNRSGLEFDTTPFIKFRKKLLDLQLFIDPDQILPQSGPESERHGVVEWKCADGEYIYNTCQKFEKHVRDVDDHCGVLAGILRSTVTSRATSTEDGYTPLSRPPRPSLPEQNLPDHTEDFRLPSPFKLPPPLHETHPPTPLSLSPNLTSSAATLFTATSPSAPFTPLASLPTPYPFNSTLSHQEPSSSARSSPTLAPVPTRRRPKTVRQQDTNAGKKVQEFVLQYNKPVAGRKRKHDDREGTQAAQPPPQYAQNPAPLPSPPTIQTLPVVPPFSPPPLPVRVGQDQSLWSLRGLTDSLPPNHSAWPQPPPIPPRNRERATISSVLNFDAASITGSSSGSSTTNSSANSILSAHPEPSTSTTLSSKHLRFDPGSCKLWHRTSSAMAHFTVLSIEIRRTIPPPRASGLLPSSSSSTSTTPPSSISTSSSGPNNARTTLHVRTTNGQEIVDDLWMTSSNSNTSPFLEHSEVVRAFRGAHDSTIGQIVRFAPQSAFHPQYSFVRRDDAIGFAAAVAGMRLLASVDVESVKSAGTHGNSMEAGCETMQVWGEGAAGVGFATAGGEGRWIKLFKNKNPAAGEHAVVEFDTKWMRAAQVERRAWRVVVPFRDGVGGVATEMKYLKIAFSAKEGRDEFLTATGLDRGK